MKIDSRKTILMTTPEFARLMNWTCKTVHCRTSSGASMPPSIKLGKRRMWRREEVEKWLEDHTETTAIDQ